MSRFAQGWAAALLLGATALHAGCGSNANSLTTGSTAGLPADAPGNLSNADPMARPVAVAWTSARAKRCGFYFDPAKLKVNYLSYERTQGASGDQLANIEKSYDTTFKTYPISVTNASSCRRPLLRSSISKSEPALRRSRMIWLIGSTPLGQASMQLKQWVQS